MQSELVAAGIFDVAHHILESPVSTPTSTTEQASAFRGFGVVELLEQLASAALDSRDKGDKLERLMKSYLRTDPMYAAKYSDVWLWKEWPGRGSQPDTGIDL